FFIPGIDIKQGIAMSGGTESLYYEVLSTFRTDIEERLPLLQTVPDKDNLRSFITSVHALKSASATIGAAEASTMAAELEKAGRAGDMTFIEKELPAFSKQLTVLAEGIRIRDAAAKEHFPSISHS
ncbi:MAG: Hpt domain-containing protein, partial [Treponema sp.]|nr:Hpt domain-containing protein [Treponema sp.]